MYYRIIRVKVAVDKLRVKRLPLRVSTIGPRLGNYTLPYVEILR